MGRIAGRIAADDGYDPLGLEPIPQFIAIIGLVGDEAYGPCDPFKERNCHRDFSDIARCQGGGDQSAAPIIGRSMYFARSSATQRANCLRLRPLLRSMPIDEPLRSSSAGQSHDHGPSTASFSKIRCLIPRCALR